MDERRYQAGVCHLPRRCSRPSLDLQHRETYGRFLQLKHRPLGLPTCRDETRGGAPMSDWCKAREGINVRLGYGAKQGSGLRARAV